MKKQISMTLAVIVFALSLTSCSGSAKNGIGWTSRQGSSGGSGGIGSHSDSGNSGNSGTRGENKDSDTYSYIYPGEPEHDFSEVEQDIRMDEYHLKTVDVPWGETHDLHMVNGQIQNYFRYTAFNANDVICNKDLDNISTISKPRVRAFPADQKGYVVYEVMYTQVFPIRSIMYETPDFEVYESEGVSYVDYYTGTKLPYLSAFERNTKNGLHMQFIYEGKRYNYGYYEFKDQDDGEAVYSRDEDGNNILTETVIVNRTDYLVVPIDYDGLLLCVYVGDWTDTRPGFTSRAHEDIYVFRPEPFDDEENLDDYVFFGISRSK